MDACLTPDARLALTSAAAVSKGALPAGFLTGHIRGDASSSRASSRRTPPRRPTRTPSSPWMPCSRAGSSASSCRASAAAARKPLLRPHAVGRLVLALRKKPGTRNPDFVGWSVDFDGRFFFAPAPIVEDRGRSPRLDAVKREDAMRNKSALRYRPRLCLLLLVLAAAPRSSPAGSEDKVRPSLGLAMREAPSPGQTVRVWVYFKDKGLRDAASLRRALAEARAGLRARSLQRRAKTRSAEALVDEKDLPVAPSYAAQVQALSTGGPGRLALAERRQRRGDSGPGPGPVRPGLRRLPRLGPLLPQERAGIRPN